MSDDSLRGAALNDDSLLGIRLVESMIDASTSPSFPSSFLHLFLPRQRWLAFMSMFEAVEFAMYYHLVKGVRKDRERPHGTLTCHSKHHFLNVDPSALRLAGGRNSRLEFGTSTQTSMPDS